ncbi:ABC transporter substrate-binding protein [Tenacibaculum jejuense]|uniref:Leucine-binding protein domain-containing protein n=1 Tax=Tenacibaculum jejuense TaxID=584609 RepID=A0A238UD33_9FLAO|nr:ABC transporter substrate-binding protein [Tenacibaculum jejuense]SNR17117.1 protein of unknown function [Tenacibaculum jejuense]
MKKIGVLLPSSKAYPKLSKEFIAGLTLNLPKDFEIKVEGIGFGENKEVIKNAIQKLVYQENISILTGILGHKDLDDICEFVSNLDEVMIFSNLGASTPLNLNKWSNIYCNSFQLNKSTYLLGNLFTEEKFEKIGISTCYNDAGYAFHRILETAFKKEEKLEFAGHFITPLYPRKNEAELMLSFIKEAKPDAIFCSHNGVFAQEHADFLRQNKVTSKDIPMYMNPFSIDEKVLQKSPKIFDGVKCVSSWFPELNNKENKSFTKNYLNKFDNKPSIFSLLGFENSILIQDFLKDSLNSDINLKGPRGLLKFNRDTSRTDFDHYLWNLNYENDNYKISLEKKLNQDKKSDNHFFAMLPKVSGWSNAYLCH